MINIYDPIIPFKSCGGFSLYSDYDETILSLQNDYELSEWGDERTGMLIEIFIDGILHLCFAKKNKKMFRIDAETGYKGNLFDKEILGVDEKQLYIMFPDLVYDEMNEVFSTNQGLLFVTDPITHCVISVSVYIPELDSEEFWNFKW